MRKSRMQKLAIACIAAFAVLGGIEAADAQMHGGGGGSHGGGGFHDGGDSTATADSTAAVFTTTRTAASL
jgi:Spy/CpxP family protein refolding chaperone